MMVVLQWDLRAGGACELALADEVAQSEDQFLQMVCGRSEEVRQGSSRAWQNGTCVSPAGRSWC